MHSFGFGLSFGLTLVHIIKSARERCFLRLLAVIDKKGAFSETCSIILGQSVEVAAVEVAFGVVKLDL